MRVLIIGCGYVGLATGEALVRQGHEVFGLRRSPDDGHLSGLGLKPLVADITRPAELAALPGPFDWVVNTVSAGRGGAEDYRRVYLEGTRNVIDGLTQFPPARYVYTSSTGIYGQNDGSEVTETSPTIPPGPTGEVLLEAEEVLRAAWRERRFPAVILRVAGIYGPGRGYPFQAYLRGEARIEGTGGRLMNMIHREDVAGAVIAALQRGRPGEVYNAVDEEPVTQLTFYKWLSETLGRPMPPQVPEDAGTPRKRGVTNKSVSNKKLKAELGYHFKYPTYREGYGGEVERVLRAQPRT